MIPVVFDANFLAKRFTNKDATVIRHRKADRVGQHGFGRQQPSAHVLRDNKALERQLSITRRSGNLWLIILLRQRRRRTHNQTDDTGRDNGQITK